MRFKFTAGKRAWCVGMGMATALWLFLFAFADVYFGANDDQFLLRTFAGSAPAGASTFHLYIHAMYAFPLRWLSVLFPRVAWVSVFEILLLWLSIATIVKSIIQCFEQHREKRSFLWGVFGSLSFVLLFFFYLCARPTYTTVAASLSAACVAQLMSADCKRASDRAIVRSMLYSLLLLVLCYGLRQMVSLPALAFAGVAFVYRFFTCFGLGKRMLRSARPLLVVLTCVVVVMGGLAITREAEITLRGQRDYLAWQQARISVLDYIDVTKISSETRETLGWSDEQVQLLHNWYTMEETVSTEAFQHIRQNEYHTGTRTSPGAAILDFFTRSPLVAMELVVLLGIGIFCLLGLLCKRKGIWTLLALLAAGGGCAVLLAYLALQGRLPHRAVMVPALPAAALVFCLIPDCLPDARWFRAVFCGLLATAVGLLIVPTAQNVWYREPEWDYNTHASMDEIAHANPDVLFIYSNELVNDMRMFPDLSKGLPHNLMFWGGWNRGSPEYRSRVGAFGLDSDHFTPQDWLRENLRFLTLNPVQPNELLVAHLRAELGENLAWEQTQMDAALYAYRFYLAD